MLCLGSPQVQSWFGAAHRLGVAQVHEPWEVVRVDDTLRGAVVRGCLAIRAQPQLVGRLIARLRLLRHRAAMHKVRRCAVRRRPPEAADRDDSFVLGIQQSSTESHVRT